MKDGWQTKKVSEIARHSLGKMLDKAKNRGDLKPYLRNLNVRWFDFDLSDVLEMRFLPEEAAKYTAIRGDVLICEGGYPGRAAIWEQDEPIHFQKAIHRVRFHEPERSKWFLYYLYAKDRDDTLKNHFSGAGIQHFTGESLAQFEVPLPPIPEQRRIVGILDQAFAAIAVAKANAERNLQNARALFDSHIHSVFTQRSGGWVERTLGDFCSFENGDRGTNYPSKSARTTSGIPFVNAGHLTDDGIDFRSMDYISRERFDLLGAGKIRAGDILFCLRGSLGKCASVGDLPEGAIASSLVIIRPGTGALGAFVLAYLRSHLCVAMIDRFKNGAAQPNLSAGSLGKFLIPVPPISEQQRIVERLAAFRDDTQRLATLYGRKLSAIGALKHSLLDQAFSGTL